MQILVRGGLLLLIAVPFAGLLLLSPAMRGALPESAPQMSSPLQDELLREADRDAQAGALASVGPAQRLAKFRRPGPGARPRRSPAPAIAPAAWRLRPRAKTAKETSWDLVPVFFGTDREEQPDPKRLQFNAERGRRLELGQAMVTVPKSHEVPNIERPWVVKIPYFDVTIYEEAEDPDKHFTMKKIKQAARGGILEAGARAHRRIEPLQGSRDRLRARLQHVVRPRDLPHGADRLRPEVRRRGFPLQLAVGRGAWRATPTIARVRRPQSPTCAQFLDLVVKQTGAKSVSIIAHSMGNQPLLDVLKDMRSGGPESVVINEVILAAPDVDADNFANVAQRIEGIAKGVTLYAASNDRALIVSRNFWRNPRAGDVPASGPLIVPGIETIDVTAASTDSFALNHSGYAENNDLLQDIGKLILSGLRPPDQRLPALKRTPSPKGDYWRYAAP